ncbi:MAG TPA: FAD-dependent tricarballylate dehydrogenase TcuA [Burkholderiales bacterium]|nr:FAD-dependent tricarballylate dehydrogenase TcuA [Burkholderiales bacterium]
MSELEEVDVVVVGAGNAAMCAAFAAQDAGARVMILERAPEEECGGNSAFTGGATRFAFKSVDEVREVLDLTEDEVAITDFGTYTEEEFLEDMGRLTQYRCDPDLTELFVRESRATLAWMKSKGVRFDPMWARQSQKIDGRIKFYAGLICATWGAGQGLVESLHKIAKKNRIPVLYETAATRLIYEDGIVRGVIAEADGKPIRINAGAVVLACGGFESNAEMRARYLGPNWDLAKVRGTRFNMGDGIRMAIDIGAMPFGHWSGAHAVGWDMNAPPFGEREIGDLFQKHSYPYGIMVNANGERFVDEGADFRNFTYAKYGVEVLKQPGMFAWQIFDSKVNHLLRHEYQIRKITKAEAPTLEGLVEKLEGVNAPRCLETIAAFNKAVQQDVPFDPVVRDGRGTTGLAIPKSNWSNVLDTPPFHAYAVTCGITFTFGGVKASPQAAVQNVLGRDIPGLYVAGEMLGGLFYFNYPSGTGLVSGAVFGRIAGTEAAKYARQIAPVPSALSQRKA